MSQMSPTAPPTSKPHRSLQMVKPNRIRQRRRWSMSTPSCRRRLNPAHRMPVVVNVRCSTHRVQHAVHVQTDVGSATARNLRGAAGHRRPTSAEGAQVWPVTRETHAARAAEPGRATQRHVTWCAWAAPTATHAADAKYCRRHQTSVAFQGSTPVTDPTRSIASGPPATRVEESLPSTIRPANLVAPAG